MITRGTKVRLVGNIWLPEWRGRTGVVTTDGGDGSFIVTVDSPPASAIFGGDVIVHQADQVEVL